MREEWSIQFRDECEQMTPFQPTALIPARTPYIRDSGVTTILPLNPLHLPATTPPIHANLCHTPKTCTIPPACIHSHLTLSGGRLDYLSLDPAEPVANTSRSSGSMGPGWAVHLAVGPTITFPNKQQ